MSILLPVVGSFSGVPGSVPGGGPEDAAVLSSNWLNLFQSWPNSLDQTGDRTVTWTSGGPRTISITYFGLGIVSYRINSGSYIPYDTPFTLESNQTLGWQIEFQFNESSSIVVTEAGASSRTLATITTNATNWPFL